PTIRMRSNCTTVSSHPYRVPRHPNPIRVSSGSRGNLFTFAPLPSFLPLSIAARTYFYRRPEGDGEGGGGEARYGRGTGIGAGMPPLAPPARGIGSGAGGCIWMPPPGRGVGAGAAVP